MDLNWENPKVREELIDMIDWMTHYGNNCWMSIFYNNHDNPRMVSKICKDVRYHKRLSKLLAGTREHTRVLLPWNEKLPAYHEGLTQEIREDVQEVYKKLIALRHKDDTLVYGDFEVLDRKKNCFTYKRSQGDSAYIIDCNLSKKKRKAYPVGDDYRLIYASASDLDELGGFGVRLWKHK